MNTRFFFAVIFSFFVFIPAASAQYGGTQCTALTIDLKQGNYDTQTGNQVSVLQNFLRNQGYLSSAPTGYFGSLTLGAVRSYQSANGIPSTGFVGPMTREKIRAATCGTSGTTTTLPATPNVPVNVPTVTPTVTPTTNTVSQSVSINSFSVSPSSVSSGETAKLSWSSTGATSCNILYTSPYGFDFYAGFGLGPSGTYTVFPTENTTYKLYCFNRSSYSGAVSGSATRGISVSVAAPARSCPLLPIVDCLPGYSSVSGGTDSNGCRLPDRCVLSASSPPTLSLSVSPSSITLGQSATLTWSSSGATSCAAAGAWSGTIARSGTSVRTPSIAGNYTYIITCTGSGGSVAKSVAVTVTPASAPTLTLTASPVTITAGQSSTLSWTSTDTTRCLLNGELAVTPLSTGSLYETKTFSITCTGAGGSATKSVTVTVTPALAPTLTLTANPATITAGQTSMLSWDSSWTDQCTVSRINSDGSSTQIAQSLSYGAQGNASAEGIAPTQTTTYKAICTGAGGSTTKSATVTVIPLSSAPTLSVQISATSIPSSAAGDFPVAVTWSSTKATSCSMTTAFDNGSSATKQIATSGTETSFPFTGMTFTITCTGSGVSVTKSVRVSVAVGANRDDSAVANGLAALITSLQGFIKALYK